MKHRELEERPRDYSVLDGSSRQLGRGAGNKLFRYPGRGRRRREGKMRRVQRKDPHSNSRKQRKRWFDGNEGTLRVLFLVGGVGKMGVLETPTGGERKRINIIRSGRSCATVTKMRRGPNFICVKTRHREPLAVDILKKGDWEHYMGKPKRAQGLRSIANKM